MKNILAVSKAFSDEGRLKVLLMLAGTELCVCRIVAGLGQAPSTVSKHLSILEQAGLIETRKKGRWVHCRLPARPAPEAAGALQWLFRCSGRKPRAAKGKVPGGGCGRGGG